MAEGQNGDHPEGAWDFPLINEYGSSSIATEMIGQDEQIKKLFLSLTYFIDEQEAADYADEIHRCDRYNMRDRKLKYLMRIAAKVSVKGYRSAQLVDILTQIQRMADQSRKERASQVDTASNRGIKQNA